MLLVLVLCRGTPYYSESQLIPLETGSSSRPSPAVVEGQFSELWYWPYLPNYHGSEPVH